MSWAVLLVGACFFLRLCIGQSTTPAPTASCDYCFLAPGYEDVSSAPKEHWLFTAYSMTSAFAQAGSCVTVSGASSPLPTPYSVAKPASTATADPAQYQSALATWFVNYLRVPDWGICGKNGSLAVHMANANTIAVVNVAVPTILGVVSSTPVLSPATTATVLVTQSALPHSGSAGLSTGAKVAIGLVVTSVVVLVVLLPGIILWYRHRKQHAAVIERRTREKLDTDSVS